MGQVYSPLDAVSGTVPTLAMSVSSTIEKADLLSNERARVDCHKGYKMVDASCLGANLYFL